MFTRRSSLVLVAMIALSLIASLVVACDDDDDGTTVTVTETATATAAATSTTTEPPTTTNGTTLSDEPVKIGALTGWSGPVALAGLMADKLIALVEDEVKEMGGILGGRPLKIVRYDDEGQVAQTVAGWTKLALDDKVSAVVFGGSTAATALLSSDQAEEFHIPLFTMTNVPEDLSDRPYTVRCVHHESTLIQVTAQFVLDKIKPQTAALLSDDEQSMRRAMGDFKDKLESGGVEITYERYIPLGTGDFSPYLTAIKHADPDVVIAYFAPFANYVAIFKQVAELGGWGDIKFVSNSISSSISLITDLPAAVGTYHYVIWTPGMPYPASQRFESQFMEKYGSLPTSAETYFYLPLMTAVHAIELAGTDDPESVAEAARSGELTWDSPAGPFTVGTDGENSLEGYMIQVGEDGQYIPVE